MEVGFRSGGCFSMLGGKTQKWKMDSVVIFCEQMGFSDSFEDGNFSFFLFQDFVKCFDQIIVSVGADV